MATQVTVSIKSDSRYPVNRKRLRSVVNTALEREGIVSATTVSIAVVGDRKMQHLNKTYHEIDATTDVLSFPYTDPQSSRDEGVFVTPPETGLVLGDIVVSYPQAVRQAASKNVLVDEEMDFLVDHGMQHLLGHHHD